MTTLCNSPDDTSSIPRSISDTVLSTLPYEMYPSEASNNTNHCLPPLSGHISPVQYHGEPSSQTTDDVPFFTVARYRNPTAPTTYELAAVPPLATFVQNPNDLNNYSSMEDTDDIISPAGAGESFYNGSLDLSPVSPVELAFGKVENESEGEWLGKSFDLPCSASFTNLSSNCRLEDNKDQSIVSKAKDDSLHGSHDNTNYGCINLSSDNTGGEKEESRHIQESKSKSNVFNETPVRGFVSFQPAPSSAKPPILKPKPNLKSRDKPLVKRRESSPSSTNENLKPNNARTLINHRNSIAVDVYRESLKEGNGAHNCRFDTNEQRRTDNIKRDVNDRKSVLYEDASVTDAAERLENVPLRSCRPGFVHEQVHKTSSAPLSRSREPSLCLESDIEKYPETEAEYIALLQRKITEAHERQLYPLQEDLADWLMKLLGEEGLTPENLLTRLDNGVLVCRLASLISSKAQEARDKGLSNLEVPRLPYRTWVQARSGTFFARDNISNFLRFCRRLGVHSNLLFETEDLVCGSGVRGVVLCLLEVGRLAQMWWNLEPPGLVKLERELDGNELSGRSDSGYSNTSSPRDSTPTLNQAQSNSTQQQSSKSARPRSAPSQLPVATKMSAVTSREQKKHVYGQTTESKPCQAPHLPSTQTHTSSQSESQPKPLLPRGQKPIPPPKPASIKKAVSRITKRPSSFPTSRTYDRGWSGAMTTPTTPVSTPTHSKTQLPMAKTPRSSGRSTPNTTPTTPTQCRKYMVSMQRAQMKPFTPKFSARATPRTPSRSPSFCSRLKEGLAASKTKDESDALQSDLDKMVHGIAEQTQGLCGCKNEPCDKRHIKKISDGRYDILGRTVLVRLLKGKHVMVRVGGGWDTLEHYLLRHDPTQVRGLKTKKSSETSFVRKNAKCHCSTSTLSEKSGKCSTDAEDSLSSRRSSITTNSESTTTTCTESDYTHKEEEDSFSSQSASTTGVLERDALADTQSVPSCNEYPSPQSKGDESVMHRKKNEKEESITSDKHKPKDDSSVFGPFEVKVGTKPLGHSVASKTAVDDCSVLFSNKTAHHHHQRDGMGSCDLLSAPVGENGDFQTPASLSSKPVDIMMASCPSLDLAESSLLGFSTMAEDSRKNESENSSVESIPSKITGKFPPVQ